MIKKISITLLLMAVLVGFSKFQSKEMIIIGAASSLKEPLEKIEIEYEKKSNIDIAYSFGSSGAIKTQIQQGANFDMFFSADKEYINELIQQNYIDLNNSIDLLSNEIVLITSKSNNITTNNIEQLLNSSEYTFAIGNPESVPLGKYTKQYLEEIYNYELLSEKLNFASDAKQVLTWIEKGEIDFGFVYKTDALSSSEVKIVKNIDNNKHDYIIYPFGIININNDTKNFFDFIKSKEVLDIFKEYGFIL